MRNAILGSFIGVLAALSVIAACGGSSGGDGDALVLGQDLLAIVQIEGSSTAPTVMRHINNLGPPVTVTRESEGRYLVDFGFDLSDRLWIGSCATTKCDSYRSRMITVGCKSTEPTCLTVHVYDPTLNSPTDNGHFVLAVY